MSKIGFRLASLVIGLGSGVNFAAAADLNLNICKINNQVVKFQRVESEGSVFIVTGRAEIDSETALLYHYNPFYDIGGTVKLLGPDEPILLLRWDNGFSSSITTSVVEYKGNKIECRVH